MSQPLSEAPVSAKTADDIFDELSKGDDQETLDFTKSVKDSKTEKKETVKADESDKEDDEEDEDKDTKDEDDDELADIEEELDKVDEEKLELIAPVRRREILKEYPDLFKKFPYLEKAYYREQQFTEILPTIEDAKTAAESHQVLQRYTEDMVEKGNVHNVLKLIKDTNPETFANVVDNYLDHLNRVDPSAVLHVQSNLVKQVIIGMVNEAKRSQDDDLRVAALMLNKWAFGSSQFIPPQKLSKGVNNEETEKHNAIARREEEFAKHQLDTAVNEVNGRVNNIIKGAIDNNIDPSGSMTEYVKKNASRDALDKLGTLISNDKRFQQILDKLWEKAAQKNYSRESQDEVKKAVLAKAKSLLAPVLKSARNEALKGMGKRVKADDAEETETPERQKVDKSDKSERRLSSSTQKAKLESLKGKSSYEALQALMGD